MKAKIKLLLLGTLIVAPICYFGARRATRAHAAETAPPSKLEPLEAQTLRGDLLELATAAQPFYDALTKVKKAEDKYHLRLQTFSHPGPVDTIDFATGEIKRATAPPVSQ